MIGRPLRIRCAAAVLLTLAWTATVNALGEHDVDVEPIRRELELGDYARAEADARALLETVELEPGSSPRDVADVLDVVVEAIWRNGTFMAPDAPRFGARAVLFREADADEAPEALARSLRNLGDLRFFRAEYAEAELLYERALEIQERTDTDDQVELALTLASMARLTWEWRAEHSVATAMFERAHDVLESEISTEDPRTAVNLVLWGDQLRAAGALVRAEGLLRRAIDVLERTIGTNHPVTAIGQTTLATTLRTLGNTPESLALQEAALETFEHTLGETHPVYAFALIRWGLYIWVDESRLDDAREAFERAIDILEASVGPDHPWVAVGHNYAGNVAMILGDERHSRLHKERALFIRERTLGPDHPDTAMSANNLGTFYKATYEYDKALRLYRRAARIWERIYGPGDYRAEGVYANVGLVLKHLGDLDGAESALTRGLRGLAAKLGDDHPYVGFVTTELGKCKELQGADPAEVRALFERSVEILDRGDASNWFDLSDALFSLASILERDPSERERARQLHERSLAMRQQMFARSHPLVGVSTEALGRLAALDGNPDAARALAVDAEDLRREHLRLTARLASERDALRYSWRGASALDLLLSLTPEQGDEVAVAWDRVIRSRALVLDELARRQRDLGRARDPDVARLLDELQSVRKQLVDLVLMAATSGETVDHEQQVDRVRAEKERLERELAARSAEFRDEHEQRRVGFDEVRAGLPAGASLLAYIRYVSTTFPDLARTPHYAALILSSRDAEPRLIDLGDAEQVETTLDLWLRELSSPPSSLAVPARQAEQECRDAGTALRRLIWDPIIAYVPSEHRLLVVPDGVLHRVGFAAFPTPDGRYVLEVGPEIHILSSEKDITARATDRLGDGLLLAGDPDFDRRPGPAPSEEQPNEVAFAAPASSLGDPFSLRGATSGCVELGAIRFGALPGTRKEVETVADVWSECAERSSSRCSGDPVALLGPRAHESLIKDAVAGRRVIHLATHGFFGATSCDDTDGRLRGSGSIWTGPGSPVPLDENPLSLSALAFSGVNRRTTATDVEDDGLLTAAEVASLDLSGVEWAVLSGCDTGRGAVVPGEGVLGFRRAFRLAGARSVIMSLWPVEDETTREWMHGLYAARAQGATTAGAVRDASLAVLRARRESGDSTHPFFWGAFVAEGQ